MKIPNPIKSKKILFLIFMLFALTFSKKSLERSYSKSKNKDKKQITVYRDQPHISYVKASGVVEADEVNSLNIPNSAVNTPINSAVITRKIEPSFENVSILQSVSRSQTPILGNTGYYSSNSKNVVIEDNNARMNLNYVPQQLPPYSSLVRPVSAVTSDFMNIKKTPSGSILMSQPPINQNLVQVQSNISIPKSQVQIRSQSIMVPQQSSEVVINENTPSDLNLNSQDYPFENMNIDEETINKELTHIKTEMNISHFDNSTKLISNLIIAIESKADAFPQSKINAWYSVIERIILDSKIKMASFVKNKVTSKSTRLNRLLNRLQNPNSNLVFKKRSQIFSEDPLGLSSSK